MAKNAAKHKDGKRWRSSKWIQPDLREAIYIRDGYTCMWCGATGTQMLHTLDHLYPAGPDGTEDNRPSSLVLACLTCNSHRGKKSLAEWLLVLAQRGKSITLVLAELVRRTTAAVDREAGKAALLSPAVIARKRRASWLCRQQAVFRESESELVPASSAGSGAELSAEPGAELSYTPPVEFINGEPVITEELPYGF